MQTTINTILSHLRRAHRRAIIAETARRAALVILAAAMGSLMGYFVFTTTL